MFAALASAGYMARRGPDGSVNDLLPGGAFATVIYIVVALAVVIGLQRVARRGALAGALGRIPLYLSAAVLGMIAVSRAQRIRWEQTGHAIAEFPPSAAKSMARRLHHLAPLERANWGARIAVHALVDSSVPPLPLVIPADWPFPDDVQIAARTNARGATEIWSRAGDGTAACMTIPARSAHGADSVAQLVECEQKRSAPAGLTFAPPVRIADSTLSPIITESNLSNTKVSRAGWTQHRADGARTGIASVAAGNQRGWRTMIDGPVRASASVVGDVVLIGAHDTGVLEALDLESGRRRWSARAPNWIHQDAVSDGRIVVVGFGNVWPSFAGRAPSGVAAYDIENGRHLWSRFDESSVMTSPVIVDTALIYATAGGVLRKRVLRTGRLIAERQLPGGVIMGPPAVTGDTLVVALDKSGICAVLVSSFEPIWCRRIPGMRMLGHAAPSVSDGIVIASGPGMLRAADSDFFGLPLAHQLRLLSRAFGPEPGFVGQNYSGFSLRDGATLWSSRFFPATRDVSGHSSGTAAIAGGLGVIVLPFADSVVAFRATSGSVTWTAGAHGTRGAPLIVDGHVIIAGRDGVIETRNLLTGALECTTRRRVGYDRAGPALAGDRLIFADLGGGIEAMRKQDLIGCRSI